MAKNILVVDSNVAFATMLQEALEQDGHYHCCGVTTGKESLQAGVQQEFDLAVIDAATQDMALSDIVAGLRVHLPALAIMLIPLYGDELPPEAQGLDLQGVLPKPFFLPDLTGMVEAALAAPVGQGSVLPRSPKATGLTTGSRRYTIEATTKGDPALVPPPVDSPSLAAASPAPSSVPSESISVAIPPALQDVTYTEKLLNKLTLPSKAHAALLIKDQQLYAHAGHFSQREMREVYDVMAARWLHKTAIPPTGIIEVLTLANGEDFLVFSLSVGQALSLSLVFPNDTPLKVVRSQTRHIVQSLLTNPMETGPLPSLEKVNGTAPAREESSVLERETPHVVPPNRYVPTSTTLPVNATDLDDVDDDMDLDASIRERQRMMFAVPSRSDSSPMAAYRNVQGMYTLTYTFLWMPKLPNTPLQGDLAQSLQSWIPNLATAYDWRVEHLQVKPTHLQLIIACSPADAPETIVKRIMEMTSQYIVRDFPRVGSSLPNGTFWAPMYGCQVGRQFREEEIHQFVQTVRAQQGLARK